MTCYKIIYFYYVPWSWTLIPVGSHMQRTSISRARLCCPHTLLSLCIIYNLSVLLLLTADYKWPLHPFFAHFRSMGTKHTASLVDYRQLEGRWCRYMGDQQLIFISYSWCIFTRNFREVGYQSACDYINFYRCIFSDDPVCRSSFCPIDS